jgi:hypothetical protein
VRYCKGGKGEAGPGILNGLMVRVIGQKYFPEKFSEKVPGKKACIAGVKGKATIYMRIFTK